MVTPLKPMEPGKLWCIFEQRGTYEFLCAPETGADFLEHGMVVDGKRLPVRKIDEYASVNAWHIEVVDPDMNKEFLAA